MAEWKRNVADDHKTLMHLLILFTTSENSSLQAGNCRPCDTGKRVWFSESIVVQAEGKRVTATNFLNENLVPIISTVSNFLCRDTYMCIKMV